MTEAFIAASEAENSYGTPFETLAHPGKGGSITAKGGRVRAEAGS